MNKHLNYNTTLPIVMKNLLTPLPPPEKNPLGEVKLYSHIMLIQINQYSVFLECYL